MWPVFYLADTHSTKHRAVEISITFMQHPLDDVIIHKRPAHTRIFSLIHAILTAQHIKTQTITHKHIHKYIRVTILMGKQGVARKHIV